MAMHRSGRRNAARTDTSHIIFFKARNEFRRLGVPLYDVHAARRCCHYSDWRHLLTD